MNLQCSNLFAIASFTIIMKLHDDSNAVKTNHCIFQQSTTIGTSEEAIPTTREPATYTTLIPCGYEATQDPQFTNNSNEDQNTIKSHAMTTAIAAVNTAGESCSIIGAVLGTIIALLLLILIVVITGWILTCYRSSKHK